MARRKGSPDKFPRKRRGFKPLLAPDSGPDLPRETARACDCSSLIAECRDRLAELSGRCSSCNPQPACGPGSCGSAPSA